MPRRDEDWFRQSERDLRHARNSIEAGDYEWACFAAQQASEKSLKAVYEKTNKRFIGHSRLNLLRGLAGDFKVPE